VAVKYGIEAKDIRRLRRTWMKFTRSTTGYSSLDIRRIKIFQKNLIDPIEKKLVRYKQNLFN